MLCTNLHILFWYDELAGKWFVFSNVETKIQLQIEPNQSSVRKNIFSGYFSTVLCTTCTRSNIRYVCSILQIE